MTIHFSQFDESPPALDEVSAARDRQSDLEGLTGCQIARAIEGQCREPECQSHGLELREVVLSDETCRRLSQAAQPAPRDEKPQRDSLSSGIFHTDNRLRCVL